MGHSWGLMRDLRFGVGNVIGAQHALFTFMFCQFVALAVENRPSANFTLPSISFDNGLVELTALTTLLSSSAAASLVLGSRGPSGLAWATMSAFGMIAVVKACLSAATPGWLRETIGVRSSVSDLAVGLQLDLGSNYHNAKRVRKTLDSPIAIQCQGDLGNEDVPSRSNIGNDVYAHDFSTSTMIRSVAETEPGKPTRIFSYARYSFVRKHNKRVQIGGICLSFLKLIEAYVLWRNDSAMLAIVTSTPWCYFLISAIIAEVIALKWSIHPETMPGTVDVLSGRLPAVKQPGGSRKIVIGATRNPRDTLFWTIVWSLGTIICASSMFLTYLVLGKQSKDIILMWAEFQALWMIIRLVLYHLIEPDDPLAHRQLMDESLSSVSRNMRMRVLGLTMALSKYQIYSHPRGDYSYDHDCFVASEIPPFFTRHASSYPINNANRTLASVQVSVKAVIGDTTLSSATWISGSTLTSMDLYDSCVVVFNTRTNGQISNTNPPSSSPSLVAIPAVRALAGLTVGRQPADPEKVVTAGYAPKGASNKGYGISWLYWIPLDSGRWLFLSTLNDSLDIRGRQVGCVMSDAEVTDQLASGKYNLGFSDVDEVKVALEMSRRGFRDLLSISIGSAS